MLVLGQGRMRRRSAAPWAEVAAISGATRRVHPVGDGGSSAGAPDIAGAAREDNGRERRSAQTCCGMLWYVGSMLRRSAIERIAAAGAAEGLLSQM